MIAIGCGGRDYREIPEDLDWFVDLAREHGITEIVEGGASGADAAFRAWGQRYGLDGVTFWANWVRFNTQAGPRRNARQLAFALWAAQEWHQGAICVLALPGGRGTANMVQQARAADITIFTTV